MNKDKALKYWNKYSRKKPTHEYCFFSKSISYSGLYGGSLYRKVLTKLTNTEKEKIGERYIKAGSYIVIGYAFLVLGNHAYHEDVCDKLS